MTIDMQNSKKSDYPDLAVVYFTDGATLGPAIVLRSVGAELAELILEAFSQVYDQGLDASIGNVGAAMCFRAVATGNEVSLLPPPMCANYPMQLGWLHQPDQAVGGIGSVIVNVKELEATTYGGRGFPEVAESNPYQPCTFLTEVLRGMPPSGVEPSPEPKKPAPKKTAARKKAGRKKTTGPIEV